METDLDFKSISKKLYEMNHKNPEYNLTKEKWIDILKTLFHQNGKRVTFDFNNVLSRSVLSYYKTCNESTCVDTQSGNIYAEAIPRAVYEAKQLTPAQRLEGYVDTSYEKLKEIVKSEHQPLFSKLRPKLLKSTERIRANHGAFVPSVDQWIYLLIRLHNELGVEVILDDAAPEIIINVQRYYEHPYGNVDLRREVALRMPVMDSRRQSQASEPESRSEWDYRDYRDGQRM